MTFFGKSQVQSRSGIGAMVGPFGELLTESRSPSIKVQFQYPQVNTDFDLNDPIVTGDGSVTAGDGLLVLASAVGTSYVQSKASVRYRPGQSGYARFTASFDGEGVGEIGLLDDDSGFGIRCEDGNASLFYRRDGADTFIQPKFGNKINGRFDGGTIDVGDIDWTKINIFGIDFGYLGVASPVFWIKRGEWQVLGTIETEGVLTSTHINNPVLPISAHTSGGMTLKTASWAAGVMGDGSPVGARYFPAVVTATLSGTDVATLGTFRNKTTYQTLTNKVQTKAIRYSLHVDAPASGSGTVEFRIIKNATLAGVPAWSDIDTANSVIEVDGTATYDSDGHVLIYDWIGYASGTGGAAKIAGDADLDVAEIGLFLYPGETATITAQNVSGSQNVTCRVAFNWIELF